MVLGESACCASNSALFDNVSILQSQPYVASTARGWHRKAYLDVYQRVAEDVDFPCVFGKNAIRKNLLKFIFVEGNTLEDLNRLAKGLLSFVEVCSNWNGDLNTAYPLVIAFSKSAISGDSIDAFHAFGWQTLQRLHSLDVHPWPEDVSYDPDSETWTMCFGRMPIFCNMSHPSHRQRASRNLGEHFKFIINPRERFDKVAGDTPAGRRARANIRQRILAYDGQPHSPHLGSYGDGSLEWWQYALPDQNDRRTEQKCPFLHKAHAAAPLNASTGDAGDREQNELMIRTTKQRVS